MTIKVSSKAKDILQKYASGLFKDSALAFYGVHVAPVKELINVELPVVEVTDSATDYVFLLEDDTYLHLEFQSGYNENDLLRFASYDIRLYERDKRKVITLIIYSSRADEVSERLNIGTLEYRPQIVLMGKYDGDGIYNELERKINNGEELTDVDILNLVFLPLMRYRGERKDLAVKSVELAQSISDRAKRDLCIASIIAFGNKHLNDDDLKKMKEVIMATDLITMIVEEKLEEMLAEKLEEKLAENLIKVVTKLLQKNTPMDVIADATELSVAEIVQIKSELDNMPLV